MSPTFKSKIDLRGLEPPEPMTRILEALATAPRGILLEARLERRPMFLLEELARRGQAHTCTPHPEGGWMIALPIGTDQPAENPSP